MASKCDMYDDCANKVTHIGEKGFIYCAEHVSCRRGFERCRRMRPFELKLIAIGIRLPSYAPLSKVDTRALIAKMRGAA